MKYSEGIEQKFGAFIKSKAGVQSNLEPRHPECDFVDFEQVGIIAAEKEEAKALQEGYTQEQKNAKTRIRIEGAMKDWRRKHLGMPGQWHNLLVLRIKYYF